MSDTVRGTLVLDGQEYEFVATATGKKARRPRHEANGGKQPDLPAYYRVAENVVFVRFGSKDGESAKGEWTRFWAKDSTTGLFYSTFDTNLGALMKEMSEKGEPAKIAYTEKDDFRTFVGIPQSEGGAEVQEEQGEVGEEERQPDPQEAPPPEDDDNLPF